ncbi:hypothetical protein ABHW52_06735 [Pediococcus pentosaceus]
MIDRYARPEMQKIWNRQSQFQSWLDVEIAVVKAWNKDGKVPDQDLELIEKKAKFDLDRIDELESQTHHDVIAFTRSVSESFRRRAKMDSLRINQYRRCRYSAVASTQSC